MNTLKHSFALTFLTAGLSLTGFAQTPAAELNSHTTLSAIDLVRADLKTEKALIIAQNLVLTGDESDEFWPLYNDYTLALNLLLDERLVLLKEYMASHEHMTNEQATALAAKTFDFEAKRVELRRTWFKKFAEVVPAKKAAQFFQIESQINAALDVMLTDAMPLIK